MSKLVPFVLGISGRSGSGKSWLVSQLETEFKHQIAVLRFDDYYLPFEEQATDENGYLNFDLPTAVDHQKFQQDLLKLIEGHPVLVNEYQFELENAEKTVRIVSPAPLIVAEGLFVYHHPHIHYLFSAKVLVEADTTLSLQRRLRRDAEDRGISGEKSLYQWHNHVLPAYEKYILPFAAECDLIIQNSDPQETQLEQVKALIAKLAHPTVVAALNNG